MHANSMNFKGLIAAIAVTCATATALTVQPVLAQSGTQSGSAPAATSPAQHQHRGNQPKLNLTAEQKTQIEKIRAESRAKIAEVLTKEQKDQLAAAKKQGNKRDAMRSLNLSDSQKTRMRAIEAETKQRINAILTPEQRQQMQQHHRQKPANQ